MSILLFQQWLKRKDGLAGSYWVAVVIPRATWTLVCRLCPGLGHISGYTSAMKQNCKTTDCLTLMPAGIISPCLDLFTLQNQVALLKPPLGNGPWSVSTPDAHLGIGWGASNDLGQKLCQKLQLQFNGEKRTHTSRGGFGRSLLPAITSTLFSPTLQALLNLSSTSPKRHLLVGHI